MITAVTSFVPIPDHPRSIESYREIGSKLLNLDIPLMFMEDRLDNCWLYKFLVWRGKDFTHSVSDNPAKNTPSYHIVQAQKTEWLLDAAIANMRADIFVWIDFGIFHLKGMTGEIIKDFLQRAESEQAIAIPGCWRKGERPYNDQHPYWRFCGGVMVVPRKYVMALDIAWKNEYADWITYTNNVSWEVNTLSRLEDHYPALPIWWYKADHDASIFTAYKGTSDAADDRLGIRPH